MKVTKRVEEHIRQRVERKAFEQPRLKALEKAAIEELEAYENMRDSVIREATDRIYKWLAERGLPNIREEAKREILVAQDYFVRRELPRSKERDDARAEMRDRIHETVNSIIISIELGNKSVDLEDILANVSFE